MDQVVFPLRLLHLASMPEIFGGKGDGSANVLQDKDVVKAVLGLPLKNIMCM